MLNWKAMLKQTGVLMTILGLSMIPALLISCLYGEKDAMKGFFLSILPMVGLGIPLIFFAKTNFDHLKVRDGIAAVSLSWLLAPLLGSLPYVFSGEIPHFVHAVFESASGFTTTGATILDHPEELPHGLLFWRAFTQWLGGIGICVFTITLLPALGINTYKLFKSETGIPMFSKFSPRLSDGAKILFALYVGLTLFAFGLFWISGMGPFSAVLHGLSTISTGGFSNSASAVLGSMSLGSLAALTLFMLIAGIDITLLYLLLKGNWRELLRDGELRLYGILIGLSGILLTINLWMKTSYTFPAALGHGFFQTISAISTTGYISTDLLAWPTLSKLVLFFLMFIGGCSASVGGGLKVIRVLILLKLIKRGLTLRLHPRAVVPVKLGGKVVSADTVSAITSFSVLYFLLFFLGILLLSLNNLDLLTTSGAVAACLNNVGPLAQYASTDISFTAFSDVSLLLLTFYMLLGRLEIYMLILLLTKQFWNPDK